jgi:hypothetical protein
MKGGLISRRTYHIFMYPIIQCVSSLEFIEGSRLFNLSQTSFTEKQNKTAAEVLKLAPGRVSSALSSRKSSLPQMRIW